MAKRGRKPQHFTDDQGTVYPGLGRRPDGRFYPIADRNKSLGTDQADALARFKQWERDQRGDSPVLVFEMPGLQGLAENPQDVFEIGKAYEKVPDEFKPLVHSMPAHGEMYRQFLQERGLLDTHGTLAPYWPEYIYWVIARWIKSQPADAAKKLDYPELRNLRAIKPPEPSLPLRHVIQEYSNKDDVSATERNRSARWFEQFVKITGARTVRDLDGENIRDYRASILQEQKRNDHKPAWVKHRFGKIKAMLAYSLDLGHDQDEIGRVLTLCKMLKPPKTLSVADADPISRADLHAILKVADAREKAITLVGLNCAFYPIDICRVTAAAVDLDKGVVVFDRTKAGEPIPRVAVLWKRTITAIKAYQKAHRHDAKDSDGNALLFANLEVRQLRKDTVCKWWAKLRSKAQRPAVVFSQLRDGAYATTVEAGIDNMQSEILVGHKVGRVKDAYIRRQPQIVADACKSIEAAYFGK